MVCFPTFFQWCLRTVWVQPIKILSKTLDAIKDTPYKTRAVQKRIINSYLPTEETCEFKKLLVKVTDGQSRIKSVLFYDKTVFISAPLRCSCHSS